MSEHGVWFLVGVPWASAMVIGRAPTSGWLLMSVLVFAVLAREPVMWRLWARRRNLEPPAAARGGAVWGAAALACGLLWAASGVGRLAILCVLGTAMLGAADVLARGLRPRPTPAGGIMGGAGGGFVATAVLAGGGMRGAGPWIIGACLAYALAVSSCAMHLFLQRVPRTPAGRPAAPLLWAWTVGAGALLIVLGHQAGASVATAAVVCLGLTRAIMAWRRPRTTAFRQLGWREAMWLAFVGIVVVALAP